MRRFVALLKGLPPLEAATWRPERTAPPPPAEPVKQLRQVNPFEAMTMLKGA